MDQAAHPLQARSETRPDGVILVLEGALDISTVQRAEAELKRAESSLGGDGALVALDLRGLEFMDSTGLRFVIAAHSRAREAGRRFVVIQGPDAVDRVFRVTRVDSLVEIVGDPRELSTS